MALQHRTDETAGTDAYPIAVATADLGDTIPEGVPLHRFDTENLNSLWWCSRCMSPGVKVGTLKGSGRRDIWHDLA